MVKLLWHDQRKRMAVGRVSTEIFGLLIFPLYPRLLSKVIRGSLFLAIGHFY